MLAKKHLPLIEPEEDEQQQIYHQLSQLDLKLKNKLIGKQAQKLQKGWYLAQNKKEIQLKKLGNGKSENTLTPSNAHIEYFSEICNQDIDQDSLFDCPKNFLGEQKHKPKAITSVSNPVSSGYRKNSKQADEQQCSFGQKNGKNSLGVPNHLQISKQGNDIYKKQSLRPSTSTKSPIFKNNNRSHEKKSLFLQKSRQKSTQMACKQTKQNKKGVNSRQKYNLKAIPIEQQIKIQQTELNKFSTFESFLSKAVQPTSQQKYCEKSKCHKEQQSHNSLECTFKPSILKKSSQMVKSTKNVVQRLSIHNQSKQKKPYNPQPPKPLSNKQRIQQLSQPRKLKTPGPQHVQYTPSFRPSLSKKSLEQMANCQYDVATRNQLWLEQKNQKLQRIKQEQDLQRIKRQGCTYSPTICQYKGDNDPHFSRFGKQGIANYFQRLSGLNKNLIKSKAEQSFQNKQNKSSVLNEQKSNYLSKGSKKQNYEEAVKQLHNRIMGLKI